MRKPHIQSILALLVVGFFMMITGSMALYPLLRPNVELTQYSQYFAQTASVYTGIVGVVIGYYFGRREGENDARSDARRREADGLGAGRDEVTPAGSSPPPRLPPGLGSPAPPRGPQPPS